MDGVGRPAGERRDEAQLVERAKLGDAAAFAEIYDRHAPNVLALLTRMLGGAGSGAQPLDVLQDVFLEAWQRVRDYDPDKASVRTWLMVRARSRALDAIARAGRQRSSSESARLLQPQEPPVQTSRPSERALAVRQALAALDADVRRALELSYFEGLTAEEIAARDGVKLGTVKSRIARGLERLERLLDEIEGEIA